MLRKGGIRLFNNQSLDSGTRNHPLLVGLLYAFIAMGVLTLAVSLVLWLSDYDESHLGTIAYAIHALSVATGSLAAGRRSNSKGWWNGWLLGILYVTLVLIVGFLAFDRGLDWKTLWFVLGSMAVGTLGGMIGINLRR